jgi:predicted NBD/HSP70 family sugar kinase
VPKKASVRDVGRVNRALLVRHLLLTGATSRGSVGTATGLSPATVTHVVAELLDEGVVREAGQLESQGGRRRTILEVDPEAAIVFGADVSETEVVVEMFDLKLTRLGRRARPIHGRRIDPSEVVAFIEETVTALLEETPGPHRPVLGLGLGVPGIVEHPLSLDEVTPLIHADVLGWSAVTLDGLGERLGFPVLTDNGAKTTTQAESWYGAAKGTDHAIVVLIGDGAGAGIITNGRLYRGSSSSAGEWGHTKISTDGIRCRCGSRGCVETFVGASAVLERWAGRDTAWTGNETDGIDSLFAAHAAGESDAELALADLVSHLGLALSNLVNLYNPQKIIIGGWFGDRIASTHLDELRASMRQFSLKQPGDEAMLERSYLGRNAATLGAATLALDRFIESGWPH